MKVLRMSLPLVFVLSLTGLLVNIFGEFHFVRFILNLCGFLVIGISWLATKRRQAVVAINLMLYSALVIFGISVLFNGGVRTPNYVGFLGVSVLASVFSTSRLIWLSYCTFMLLGAITLIHPFYNLETVTFPADHRYYTIYGVIGLVISWCLVFTREAFNKVVDKLAERENLLSSAFEAIIDPLLVFNEAGKIVYLNRCAKELDQLLETTHHQSLASHLMFEMSSKVECSLNSLISDRLFENQTQTYKTHTTIGQRSIWYSISISPYSSMALGAGALVVVRDITEQQRLTQNQKMQAVGRLANGVAHDFNNMLGAIKSANDLLMLDLDEEHQELLEMIDEATDRSANMIQQLRLFSKRNDSEESVINLNELISDVKLMLQSMSKHRNQIKLEFDEQIILFKGVREHLHSMLMNLGLNAFQAMDEHGMLSFRLRLVSLEQEKVPVALKKYVSTPSASIDKQGQNQQILIEVVDEGSGISPDLQERIFEPFFTTRKQGDGIGIGLSIVHGAIQRHRGSIEVLSQIDKGTTMKVILPYDGDLMVVKSKPRAPVQPTSFDQYSVLIIDDEVLILQSLSAMFRSLGFTVTVATSGDEGLFFIRERMSQIHAQQNIQLDKLQANELDRSSLLNEKQYDLIVLDMLMPGKNGQEVFRELQEFAAHIPVILSSGYYPEEALNEMNAKGLAGQLHKPYGLKQVRDMVSKVLSEWS